MSQSSGGGPSGEQPSDPTDTDATRVGLPVDPDATRVGAAVDDDATRIGFPTEDEDATRVGIPVPHQAPSPAEPAPEPDVDPDETFVAIREPVLPWNTPSFTPPTPPEETGTTPRRPSPLWWLIAAIVVIVVAAVIITLSLVRHEKRSNVGAAQGVVERYLDALVDGDANAALKIWHPDTASGEDVLLDQKIYAAAKNRPTRYEVLGTTQDGSSATVKAELTQSGKSFQVSFALDQGSGSGSAWKVTSGPEQQLVLREPASKAEVNGISVSLPSSENKVSLSALPGDYRVVAASTLKGVNYVDDTATVLPTSGEDGRSSLSFPSPEVRAAIDQGASPEAGGPRPANAKKLTNVSHGAVTLLSPAANIGCDFSATSKGCGVLSYRDDVTQTDGNSGKWWFDLEGGDAPSLATKSTLAAFQAKNAKPHRLHYGETVYYEDNVCAMLETGLTCWDTRTGHGMFMARKGYSTF